jgi:N-acetylneuraminate synthase
MKRIRIDNRYIGETEKPYFIADIGANHDGNLNRALNLIELAKESGANAAKFQNFKAAKIVSNKGFALLGGQISHQASWKKPVVEVYKDANLSYDWTQKIKEKCDEVEIEYFTSAYDFDSVDHVDPFVNVFKIGSGDITWIEIIKYIAKKGKPILIATGASDMKDVVRAMNALEQYTDEIVLMQCNTNYTANPENFKYINLKVLNTYRQRFPNVVLGLSDHTLGHSTVLGAIAMGANVIEKHFTDDNNRIGPDHKFAMNPQSWREMIDRANELYSALGNGIKKVEENEKQTVIVQRRGLRYARDIKEGEVLSKEDFIALRPINEGGIPPYGIEELIGKMISKKVLKDDSVKRKDFEL